jgi:RimJ/RimL family protein N-acetyltransferase
MTSATLEPVTAADAVLRMLDESDLDTSLAWRNHADSRGGFHTSAIIQPDQHRAWYRAYLEREDDFVFILDVGGRPVAQAALYDVADGAAELGRVLVDPSARGLGHAHRVVALTLRVADEVLGLERLHLEVKGDNLRAIHVYERAGFIHDPETSGKHGSLVMRRERP